MGFSAGLGCRRSPPPPVSPRVLLGEPPPSPQRPCSRCGPHPDDGVPRGHHGRRAAGARVRCAVPLLPPLRRAGRGPRAAVRPGGDGSPGPWPRPNGGVGGPGHRLTVSHCRDAPREIVLAFLFFFPPVFSGLAPDWCCGGSGATSPSRTTDQSCKQSPTYVQPYNHLRFQRPPAGEGLPQPTPIWAHPKPPLGGGGGLPAQISSPALAPGVLKEFYSPRPLVTGGLVPRKG